MILQAFGSGVALLDAGQDAILELVAACEIDFTRTDFHQLRFPTAAVRVSRIQFKLVAHVSQSRLLFDRGASLDFAVMVESYVSDQRLIAHRRATDPGINFRIVNPKEGSPTPTGDVLVNDSIMKVYLAPWVRIPLHPIRRSGRIRSLVPKDPIRDRSGATSGMMIRLRVWDLAGA